jgi:hypothetical protein
LQNLLGLPAVTDVFSSNRLCFGHERMEVECHGKSQTMKSQAAVKKR